MRNLILKQILFIACFFLASTTMLFAAQLTASVNQNLIVKGKAFHLTVTLKNSSESLSNINIKPLETNFIVVSLTQSSSTEIINGNYSSTKQLTIGLIPKHTGSITIPALHLGQLKSQPFSIEVKAHGAKIKAALNDNVFMQVTLNPKTPYIDSQAIYLVKLFFNTHLSNLSMQAPSISGKDLIPVGRGDRYQTVINGRTYRVIEQSFLFMPHSSGKKTIQPPLLSGVKMGNINASINNPFLYSGETFTLSANPIEVDVRKIPSGVNPNQWLPATKVTAQQKFTSSNNKSLKVGSPITREITIKAYGLRGDQIPALSSQDLNDANVYASPAKINTSFNGKTIVGTRTEKIVYLPTKAGNLDIPQIKLPWWNTQTHTAQTAVIPSKQLHIASGSAASQTQSPNISVIPNNAKTSTSQSVFSHSNGVAWYWYALVLALLLLWLITLILWWYGRRNKRPTLSDASTISLDTEHHSTKELMSAIKQACEQNDAKRSAQALLAWGRNKYPHHSIHNIMNLAAIIESDTLTPFITQLNATLYSVNEQSWDGQSFWECFNTAVNSKHDKNVKSKSDELPGLYP